jgi:hypothetical protein
MASQYKSQYIFQSSVDQVFQTLTSIPKVASFPVTYSDPNQKVVKLSSGVSILSWGKTSPFYYLRRIKAGPSSPYTPGLHSHSHW